MYDTEVKNLTPEEAKALYEEGALFLDVREVEEFAQARIPGAKLLPLSEFMARYSEVPRETPCGPLLPHGEPLLAGGGLAFRPGLEEPL